MSPKNSLHFQKARLWCSVPKNVGDKIDLWYMKLGVPKTAFVAMCVQAGLNSVIRGIEPEAAFTTEQWSKILGTINKEGEIEKTT